MKRLLLLMVSLTWLGCREAPKDDVLSRPVQPPPPGGAVEAKAKPPSATAAPGDTAAVLMPAKGSPERKAIVDALRPWAEEELGQAVIFQVDHLALKDGFAFIFGRPLQKDGARIDYLKTKYRADLEEGAFDDNYAALLQKDGETWNVVAKSLGSTDVAWAGWPRQHGAPREIFPGGLD